MTEISPLGDRILIEQEDAETKTKGGIILVPSAQEKSHIGVVKAIPKIMRDKKGKEIPCDLKIGDKVVFAKFHGNSIDGKENLLTVKYEDILGVVED
jgi:chaperonin GroES